MIVENMSPFSTEQYSEKEFGIWQLASQDMKEYFRNASLSGNRNISAKRATGRVNS